ncbi:MAG: MFS transporter [Candidatus Rokubacteria bacterium]|nr:MFS transporter [Candidatus Rokubacteria bacterium]
MPVSLAALGALVVSLDSSINITLPALAAAFGTGPAGVRWVIICYVLTYALTSLGAGLLADRLGPGRVFGAGLWLSGAAFLGYLAVGSFGALLVARVVQGVGGGLVYGTAPALVTLALPRERHGRGLGRLTLGMGVGFSVGPAVGGVLVDAFGWRAAFLFRAPLAFGSALAATLWLGPSRGGGAWQLPPRREWLRWPVLRTLSLAALANWAQFAVWLLAPFYLVGVLGLAPRVGGLLFMLTPLGTAAVAPLAGWLTDRIGSRRPVLAGLVAEAAGLFAIGRCSEATAPAWVAAGLLLVGLGLGLFQVPNLSQAMAAFPAARQGVAGGLAFMSRTLGTVLGVQATAMVFSALEGRLGFPGAFGAAFLAAAAVCALAALIALLPPGMPATRRATA